MGRAGIDPRDQARGNESPDQGQEIEPVLETRDLTKKYGELFAIKDINLSVPKNADERRKWEDRLTELASKAYQRRHGAFWYAYRRVHGQLYKRYVGRSDQLTPDKLDQVASLLHDCW